MKKFIKYFKISITALILAFVLTMTYQNVSGQNNVSSFSDEITYYADGTSSIVTMETITPCYDIEFFEKFDRPVIVLKNPENEQFKTDIIYIYKDFVWTFSQKLGSNKWMLFIASVGCDGWDFRPSGSDRPKKIINHVFDHYLSRL